MADAGEVQPAAFVTVKLYVPVVSDEIVLVAPVPATAPGLMVQLPAGRPFNITLPVAVAHVGWVIAPTVGAEGAPGAAFITTLADAAEVQPAVLVIVKLYVPVARPEIVLVAPVLAIAPGLMVQFPAGRPLNITLPVGAEQVGWVIAPTVGAAGTPGTALMTTFADVGEVQPAALVTVKL